MKMTAPLDLCWYQTKVGPLAPWRLGGSRGLDARMFPVSPKDLADKFEKLRVADVVDALDRLGHRDVGMMSQRIRPMWEGIQFAGVAVTARYVPYQGYVPSMSVEEYEKWVGWYYGNGCSYPYMDIVQDGNVICLDMNAQEVGLWGSHVALAAMHKGVRGVVLDGGCRDRAEIKIQKSKVFSSTPARTEVQGRIQFESMNQPIACGDVQVRPGDVIVADDDGVCVVPPKFIDEVLKIATKVRDDDKKARRARYEKLGLPKDDTV